VDENKRAHDRFTLWLPVKLDARSGRMEAVCRDASPGGILVSGGSELKVGDRVTISFWLSPEEGDAYILGRIVRVDEGAGEDGSRRMAIEFMQPVPQLEALFKRASSRPPPPHSV
jgi:PilZ domain